MSKYKIIYSDPPWCFNNKNTGGSLKSGASAHYDVMTVDDICNLPVPDIVDDDAVLFMWWVASQPEAALKVIKAWGFQLKTMTAFVWNKKTVKDKQFFGMGFNTRQSTEQCLVATRGKIKRINAGIRSEISAMISEHSRKPVEVRDRIVQLYGDLPRLEMFCRGRADGWDVFGNEAIDSITLKKKEVENAN